MFSFRKTLSSISMSVLLWWPIHRMFSLSTNPRPRISWPPPITNSFELTPKTHMKEFCTQSVLVEPLITARLQTSEYRFAPRYYTNLPGSPYPVLVKLVGCMVTTQFGSPIHQRSAI
jgi:hypothetical protein